MKLLAIFVMLILIGGSETRSEGLSLHDVVAKDRAERLHEIALLFEKLGEHEIILDQSMAELTGEIEKTKDVTRNQVSVAVAAAGVTLVHYYFRKLGVGSFTLSGFLLNLQSSASLILADILAGAVFLGEAPGYITDIKMAKDILLEMSQLKKAISKYRKYLNDEKKFLCRQDKVTC